MLFLTSWIRLGDPSNFAETSSNRSSRTNVNCYTMVDVREVISLYHPFMVDVGWWRV